MTAEIIPADVAQSVLTGMVMAAIYSIVFYAKKRMKAGESFNQTKFIATVLVGAAVGASLKLSGVQLTAGTVESRLATYAGTVALVESVLKSMLRFATTKKNQWQLKLATQPSADDSSATTTDDSSDA